MTFTTIKSFAEIAHRYDGFILDQFGVMHNGAHNLPGSIQCIHELAKNMNKKLIILSNTSSPSKNALSKLPRMGFDPSLFIGAVTSGEEAGRFIKETYGGGDSENGNETAVNSKKALMFTWDNLENSDIFLEKCGNVRTTSKVDEADFVIAHGSNIIRGSSSSDSLSLGSFMDDCDFTAIDPILNKCREQNLPMVCANPDLIVKLAGDKTAYMPGNIAQRYESLGGKCTSFGKPHAAHFQACLRELNLSADRVVHVGDSLHHDIAGANAAGIDSVFISEGIHCDDFANDDKAEGELPSVDMLEDLFQKEGHVPTYACALFRF
mmetsp:Transcript_14131/g.20576  ORF Transcript_14131/g.20576 Transcript_14131/m.20576 type:complete len:322 (+) Transcript_14131:60-1025(+)